MIVDLIPPTHIFY